MEQKGAIQSGTGVTLLHTLQMYLRLRHMYVYLHHLLSVSEMIISYLTIDNV